MSYCSISDITSVIPDLELKQLTDDVSGSTTDTSKISNAINYVDNIIDGYLRGRYNLPLSSVPDELKYIAIDFVIYRLYSRRMFVQVPENILQRYKQITSILKDIQSGKFSLGIEDTDELSGMDIRTNKTTTISSVNKHYTEEKWDTYDSWL